MSGQSASLDVREVWFTNMCLLGFNPASGGEKYNKDMFAHINRKGSEVVLHFLFCKLNSKRASEEFKYCWPYYDKKQEQEFRKICTNWITKIAKEKPHSKLPRMSASLLLSPGGDKFYQFLLRLSMYVLQVNCLEESKAVAKTVFLSSFVTSGKGLADVQSKQVAHYSLQALIIQHNKNVLERAKVTCSLHTEWEKYATQLIWEHRELNKRSRTITKNLLALEEERKLRKQDRVDSSFLDATVASKLASDQVVSLSSEIQDKRRRTRIKKVREMWKSLEKVVDLSDTNRETVECIVEDRVNQYSVDARDIALQIPDVIVKEYESLSRQGKAENTYQAGRINLICLVQMWKCSLQLIKNQLMKENGSRSFREELDFTARQLQAHRAHLSAARNLRASLAALQSSVDERIEELEVELRNHICRTPPRHPSQGSSTTTPQELTTPSSSRAGHSAAMLDPPVFIPKFSIPTLELGLIPPTPPAKAKELETADMSLGELSSLTFTGRTVSTPLAVKDLSHRILQESRLKHHKGRDMNSARQIDESGASISQSRVIPVSISNTHLEAMQKKPHEAKLAGGGPRTGIELSKSRVKSLEKNLSQSKRRLKKNKDVSEASSLLEGSPTLVPHGPATPSLKDSGIHHMSGIGTMSCCPPPTQFCQQANDSVPHRLLMPSASFNNGSLQSSGDHSSGLDSRQLGTDLMTFTPDKSMHSVVEKKELETSYFQVKDLPRAHEILADQIAAAVASQNNDSVDSSFQSSETPATPPQQQLHAVVDTVSAMGTDAFRPRDLIARTPVRSSTPRHVKKSSVEHGVSTKLEFSDDNHVHNADGGSGRSDEEDGGNCSRDCEGGASGSEDGEGSCSDRSADEGSGNGDGKGSSNRRGSSEGGSGIMDDVDNNDEQGEPRSFASKFDSLGAQMSHSSQVPSVPGREGGFFSDFSSPSLVSASGSESELSQ